MADGTYVTIVGGPAHGNSIERPTASSVNIPCFGGAPGFDVLVYTMRRCRTESGLIVEVLAPAGRPVDQKWLAANRLRN